MSFDMNSCIHKKGMLLQRSTSCIGLCDVKPVWQNSMQPWRSDLMKKMSALLNSNPQ